jgi:cobalt-zinc-cadmium efflux system outer membrane protein
VRRGAFWLFSTILVSPALAAGTGPGTPADAPQAMTRAQAVSEALAANPAIAAAREQVAQARARVAEAVALPDPTFEATLEEQKTLLRPRSATSKDLGLGLTIPFPDKLRLSGRIARTDVRVAESELLQLQQQIASETSQAYDALLVALRNRDNLAESRSLARDFLDKTRARFDAGTVARLDVVKAKVDLAQAENDLIANSRDIDTARARLNRLLGRHLGSPVVPAGGFAVPAPPPALENLLRMAEDSRPEIRAIDAQREGARAASRLAREYLLPDVGLTLSRNYTQGDPAAWSTAASVTLPLFFWSHEKGQVAEARHRESELEATRSDVLAQVGLDVRSAYAEAATARRQAVYLRDELVPEALEAYRIASASYALGGSSSLEVLDAKRTLLSAQSQYAAAVGAAGDAQAALELAVGAPLPSPATGVTDEEK